MMASALIDQIPLALAWLAYAVLHSLLAADRTKAILARRWPVLAARYRLAYNVLAVLLLSPVVAMIYAHPGPVLWTWTGTAFWIANGLAMIAIASIVLVPTGYDVRAFAGLAPEPPAFVVGPWHRIVRHPWYFVGLVLVWTRDMDLATFVSALSITIYFVIGSRLEETKLARVLGEPYREYLRRVPGLVPLPWRVLDEKTARRLAGRPD